MYLSNFNASSSRTSSGRGGGPLRTRSWGEETWKLNLASKETSVSLLLQGFGTDCCTMLLVFGAGSLNPTLLLCCHWLEVLNQWALRMSILWPYLVKIQKCLRQERRGIWLNHFFWWRLLENVKQQRSQVKVCLFSLFCHYTHQYFSNILFIALTIIWFYFYEAFYTIYINNHYYLQYYILKMLLVFKQTWLLTETKRIICAITSYVYWCQSL